MKEPGHFGQQPTDPATESRAFGPTFAYLVIALLVVAGSIAYWVVTPEEPSMVAHSAAAQTMWRNMTPEEPVPAGPAAAASNAATAASQPVPVSRVRDPNGDLTPDLRDYLNAGENPSMVEVLDRLHRAGVYTGIGAFSPPGTKPTLMGLAVPENFALPEGYVRHHQNTDDGQPIEPILMYAPDHQFLDAAGRPLAIPKNRVVPPELAPPGMPIRRVVIPPPIEPDKAGS